MGGTPVIDMNLSCHRTGLDELLSSEEDDDDSASSGGAPTEWAEPEWSSR